MSTTTTNFGWTVPSDTDLVKDGAAAIRTALGGVDTSFVDLKGGTSGQVLSKASNSDLDYTWIDNQVGDITAVTAGTGLSGGGTTGAVTLSIDSTVTTLTGTQTLTNKTLTSPVLTTPSISNIDAKGDLLAGTADNTIGTLSVGTNGQVLTADSTAATGLKWANAASGSTFAGCSLKNTTGSASVSNNTWTAITFAAEDYDSDNYHSTSSNTSRITIPTGKAGKYAFGAFGLWDSSTAGAQRIVAIYKNGVRQKTYVVIPSNVYPSGGISVTLDLAVGDYVEMYVYQDSGGTRDFFTSGENGQFTASFLGA